MTKEGLVNRVNEIIAGKGDPERAHSDEDELHLEMIELFCPDWVREEIKRLNNADFPRWCA